MKNTYKKSFEQMAKDAEAKKRMQELAGINTSSERTFSEVATEMVKEIERIGSIISAELRKNKQAN